MKKKICMIVQDPAVRGGIAAVVNGYRNSPLEEDFELLYIQSYRDGVKFAKFFKALGGYGRFLKVLLTEKPELVHIHSSFGPSFYRKIPFVYMASLFRKPIINHIHGSDYDTFFNKASSVKKKLVKKIYARCTVLIALSDAGKKELSKIVPTEKIIVIENYSILHQDAYWHRLRRPSNHTVLYLGEIGRRKGCYDIPAIVDYVAKSVPEVRFVIGGTGEIHQIQQLLKRRNLESRVEFPGWVRDKEKDRLLREADVFLLPSYHEGMPMSILDAMGYGLPVVSTAVGGIPKIVRSGENGLLCEAGEVLGLSQAIIRLLQDQVFSKTCGENSCSIAHKYSLEAHVGHLKSLYNTL